MYFRGFLPIHIILPVDHQKIGIMIELVTKPLASFIVINLNNLI